MNAAKGERTLDLIQFRVRIFLQIWTSFVLVAELVLSFDGTIAIEWPKACTYWNFPCVKRFMLKHRFTFVDLDGCQYGLTSISERTRGDPIRKPWRFACTKQEMLIRHDMSW